MPPTSPSRHLVRSCIAAAQSAAGRNVAGRSGIVATALDGPCGRGQTRDRTAKPTGSRRSILWRRASPRLSPSNRTRRGSKSVSLGREGMSGTAVVLGGGQSPHSTYMQVAGEGQQIAAEDLQKAMDASVPLRNLLLKFVQVFMVQTAHTAVANARAHIDQRLARWILMAHDRTVTTRYRSHTNFWR